MRSTAIIWILALAGLAGCAQEEEQAPEGRKSFGSCAVCHTSAPPDTPAGRVRLVGPPLYGVYGRPSASAPGFQYSKAMREALLIWDDATLDRYLESPQSAVPGTIMSFAGEPDAGKRAAIIDYLKSLDGE